MKLELETLLEMLGEDDLKKGFNEIVERRKTGSSQSGVVDFIYNLYTKKGKNDCTWDIIESEFLFEMAKRYYEEVLIRDLI